MHTDGKGSKTEGKDNKNMILWRVINVINISQCFPSRIKAQIHVVWGGFLAHGAVILCVRGCWKTHGAVAKFIIIIVPRAMLGAILYRLHGMACRVPT